MFWKGSQENSYGYLAFTHCSHMVQTFNTRRHNFMQSYVKPKSHVYTQTYIYIMYIYNDNSHRVALNMNQNVNGYQ